MMEKISNEAVESKVVDGTLLERGSKYGFFSDAARVSQVLKLGFRDSHNWDRLTNSQREALDSIATKIGRVLSGDPNHADSWHDISGYARLIEAQLLGERGKVFA